MTAAEKYAQPALPVWRAWDRDWKLTGSWHEQPPSRQLTEGGSLTVDYPSGLRKSWRVRDGQLVDEADLLRMLRLPANPFLSGGES